MSHSKRAQDQLQFTFPANTEEYAPWVATYGLRAPYGKCQCGCGQDAPISEKTFTKKGYVKGQPKRHILGHNMRAYAPPGFKVCAKCKETKPISEFYPRNDGLCTSDCKQCSRNTAMEWHFANRDEAVKRSREYRRQNKEALAAKERERRANPDYREQCSIQLKDWRERNKEYITAYNRSLQVKARNRVNKLIVSGKLPRPDTLICADCQEAMAAHYHHYNGYEREHWLDVVALCTVCHGKAHWIDSGESHRDS